MEQEQAKIDLAGRLQSLSPAKRAALEQMLLSRQAEQAKAERIARCAPEEAAALSYAEQRLWLLDQLEPNHPFYNMPLAARVVGDFNGAAFAEALSQLIQRHETLRYAYATDGGAPRRVVPSDVSIEPRVVDLRGRRPGERELHSLLRAEAREPFDLARPPLLRCVVFELSEAERIVLLVMHHIVSDGWSMWVMLGELAALYGAVLSGSTDGETSPLAPLPIQYSDFAAWQRRRLDGDHLEKQTEYWREKLGDAPPVAGLPTDHPRPPAIDFDGAVHGFALPEELSEKLNQAAQRTGATPFMLLMAAYQAWLFRYTGQADLCVGTVVAGRQRAELERLIGFFVNTLAIRTDLADDPTFEELTSRVRASSLEAFAHQEVPFDKLIEAVAPERDRSHDALFQTALIVQNPPRDIPPNAGIEVQPLPVDNGTAKYDLTFFFWEEQDGWVGQVEYRTSLFEPATIGRFVATLQQLLDHALTAPETPVSQLRLLDRRQSEELRQWNDTNETVTGTKQIQERIARWFTEKPAAPAIRHSGRTTSFAELDAQSSAVAAALQDRGIGPETPVVVCLPRSAESVVAMLGVWRAGGVYVPVDPDFAGRRLEYVLEDCGGELFIAGPEQEAPAGACRVALAELLSEGGHNRPEPSGLSSSNRAYVIYTSGSTGKPKGVEIEHRSIVNFVLAQTRVLGVGEEDRVLHALSPSFDGGLSEALLGLVNGATLVITDRDETLDPALLTNLLERERVTAATITPNLLGMLEPEQLPLLRIVLSAGDKLTGELARRWLTGRRFFNGYGPTEVTVGVSIHELLAPPVTSPPVGPPMMNMRAYVLDAHRQQVPIGVTGEVYIGGAGVARSYLNRPEETAAKFLPDPFASCESAPSKSGQTPRMYRTGDLGRWRADGQLEFVGRADDQVQLRGYRVEPGEVTAALESLPEVSQAYTCVRNDPSGESRLVSYIVPQKDGSPGAALDGEGLESQHLDSWRSLMDQTHVASGALRDPEFDITGWVSTFTGLPLPKEEMRQWAASTRSRVLELAPHDVLEIGCGSGLILLGVAPHCRSYVGTDFLERSLRQLQGVLDRNQAPWTDTVELLQQTAHEIGSLEGKSFDTIVLNSVVQYFPSADYLLSVLRLASGLLRPGGKIFLGDLRNYHLHEALASAVELARAEAGLSRRELLGRIESRLRHEEELLIAPELLEGFKKELPRLAGITLQLKEGPADNELTRYRYDAVLSFDEPETTEWLAAESTDGSCLMNLEQVRQIVSQAAQRDTPLVVRNLLNPRVAGDFEAWNRLREASEDSIVGQLREQQIQGDENPAKRLGIDPDAWRLVIGGDSIAKGLKIATRWSPDDTDRYEVLLRPEGAESASATAAPKDLPKTPLPLANQPLEEKRIAKLSPRLREGLAELLPLYMIPSAFVLLDRLPQTVQGKVDRNALPPPATGRPAWATGYVEPADEQERLLCRIWEDLLGVTPIGVEDDFFEMGGHSMLAVRVMAEIEARTGQPIPLAALFQKPTVRHLAGVLRDPEAAEAASSLVSLAEGGDAAPLFCFHPAGGTVFCYRALADHFAGVRPVIGVQAVGVDGLNPPHETMEEMVDHYARLLRRHEAEGPYHLCGWSIGGNIAYAVAERLREQGSTIGTLALFDAGATPPEESLSEEDLAPLMQALFPDLDHLPIEELRQLSPEEQVDYFTERAAQAGLVNAAELAASQHVFAVFQKNVQAVHRYPTGTYRGHVTLFRAAEQAKTNSVCDDALLGWGELAESVEAHDVASDHAQMMNPPHVDALAAMLQEALLRAESER